MSANPTKLHVAHDATTDAPEATPEARRHPVVHTLLIDGQPIDICDPDCRPPGLIAEQDTNDRGVWVRANGEPWRKSAMNHGKAFDTIRRSKTIAGAMSRLVP